MHDIKANNKNRISSLAYALIICLNLNNYAISAFLGVGGMSINISIICVLTVYSLFSLNKHTFSLQWFFLVCLLSLFFLLSSNTNLETSSFISYIVLPAILATFMTDTEKVLRYSTYFSLLLILLFPSIMRDLARINIANADSAVSVMGLSYSILPVVVAGIMHRAYYKEKRGLLLKLCFVVDIVYLFIMVMYSNRGVVLSLLVFFAFLYVKSPKKSKEDTHMTLKIIVVLLLAYLVSSYLFEILAIMQSLFNKIGIELAFLEKLIRLNEVADLSNGRDVITEYVMANVIQSPLFGHGIATISHNTRGIIDYPHNFILQLLYDGGIAMLIPIIWTIIKAVRNTLYGKNYNRSIFLMFFVVTCIPKMFFSTDMWKNPMFWLFIFSCLNHKYVDSEEELKDV